MNDMIYSDIEHIAYRFAGLVAGQYLEEMVDLEGRLADITGNSEMANVAVKALSLYLAEQGTDIAVSYATGGTPPSLSSELSLGALESYLSVAISMFAVIKSDVLDAVIPAGMGKAGRFSASAVIYMISEEIAKKVLPMITNAI